MILHKTFPSQQFFEATEEVARLVPEIGSLFPHGQVHSFRNQEPITNLVFLIGNVAGNVLEGKAKCQLRLCKGGATLTNGYYEVNYHGLPERLQASISVNEKAAREETTLDSKAIPVRIAEIREAALPLGWKDGRSSTPSGFAGDDPPVGGSEVRRRFYSE